MEKQIVELLLKLIKPDELRDQYLTSDKFDLVFDWRGNDEFYIDLTDERTDSTLVWFRYNTKTKEYKQFFFSSTFKWDSTKELFTQLQNQIFK